MVSIVALAIAVPFGVASAIYVSEIAFPAEKQLIKPYVEFIAAIPSVVLGFFGIAVVGETIGRLLAIAFFSTGRLLSDFGTLECFHSWLAARAYGGADYFHPG